MTTDTRAVSTKRFFIWSAIVGVVTIATAAGLLAEVKVTPSETAVGHQARVVAAYEKQHLPEALGQVGARAKLSAKQIEMLRPCFRRVIRAHTDVSVSGSGCFTKKNWAATISVFDDCVRSALPAKADAVLEWRSKPWPEGNALGFLMYPPWGPYAPLIAVAEKRASRGATDCGFEQRLPMNRCNVDQCMIAAVRAKRPFIAVYARQGIDSLVADAFVFDADGRGVVIRWDSMGNRFTERPCVAMITRSIHGGEHVDCK